MKDHISWPYALFMLLGAGLGSGFLSLPYALQKFPVETICMLAFNYLSGLLSCYFLIQTCVITNLESFQELVYFFGGGRAGVLFITLMQILVYSLMPIVFMYNLEVMMKNQMMELKVGSYEEVSFALFFIICLLFMPIMLFKNINRIKVLGVIITVLNLTMILQALIYYIYDRILDKDSVQQQPHRDPIAYPEDYTSPWPFAPKIAFAFEYQVYFMLIFPCLPVFRKRQAALKLAGATSTFILVFCLAFSGLAFGALQIVLNSYGIVELNYAHVPLAKEFMDWTMILSQLAQIPFKFYLGKEFVYIIYDELRNQSLSTKMEHFKKQCGDPKKQYSSTVVKKLQTDLYQIVRQPYMNMSNCTYYTIGISVYLINLMIVVALRLIYKGDAQHSANPVQYMVSILAAMIQPLIEYTLSGWLFYKACVLYDINQKMRYVALAFSIIGLILSPIYMSLVFLDAITES